ncbi:MAG: hypothetical protein HMLKMBBP_03904 [Planctomycetes bacterium]|nr:hypothetical protein [Planctomycetota bacterium]
MGGMTKGLAAALLLVFAAAASAAKEEKLAEARKLLDESRPFLRASADMDADDTDRKNAAKDAYQKLKAARAAYQEWQSANGEVDDAVGVEIGREIFWLKRLSGMDLGSAKTTKPSAPPEPKPDQPKPEPKPQPPQPEPPKPDAPKPAPPEPPPPPTPAEVARKDFAELLAFEVSNKTDPGAVKEAFEKFLADHPDPSLPEYALAARRLGQIQEELNAAFVRTADRDPDSVEGADSNATPAVMQKLKNELASRDPTARRRAAELLGATRSGAAAYVLADGLNDPDPELAKICSDGLVAIGGTRTSEILVKKYRDASAADQALALGVLQRIAKKDSVSARTAGIAMGRFVLSQSSDVAGKALDALVAMGADGGPGLVEALQTRMPMKRAEVIDAIGASGYHRGARSLTQFFVKSDIKDVVLCRGRAESAVTKLGTRCVPHLIPGLQNARTKLYTGKVLRDLTGQMFGSDDVKAWKEWYGRNAPTDEPAKK